MLLLPYRRSKREDEMDKKLEKYLKAQSAKMTNFNVLRILKQVHDAGFLAAKEKIVSKLSEAWVNTNGKYDINKAIAVVRAVTVGGK